MVVNWSKELDELRAQLDVREWEVSTAFKGNMMLDALQRVNVSINWQIAEHFMRLHDCGSGQYDAVGDLIKLNASNCVMGPPVLMEKEIISADDFTQRGGSADATIKDKAAYPEEMARDLRIPIIRLIEGSGEVR